MARASVKILGSGTSTGVPLIGCGCRVCTSADPRDRRLRAGVHVTAPDGFALQIDLSPDFRQQALLHALPRVDAALVSHCHADHALGLDELRRYNTLQKCDIPLWASERTLAGLERIFDYVAHPDPLPEELGMYRPRISFNAIGSEPVAVGPFSVRAIEIPHGPGVASAFEITFDGRRFVYASDCSAVTPELGSALDGADIALLDALRDRPHASHLALDASASALRAHRVGTARLVHIGHDVPHAEIIERYGPGVLPAFDGETLEF